MYREGSIALGETLSPHEGPAYFGKVSGVFWCLTIKLELGNTMSDAKMSPPSQQAKAEVNTALNLKDPFESAVWDIVKMNRKKRRDYAVDGDPFSNFRATSDHFGMEVWEAAEFNLVQKIERLRSLRANGRMSEPANECVEDTYLDSAAYAVLMWALYRNSCVE